MNLDASLTTQSVCFFLKISGKIGDANGVTVLENIRQSCVKVPWAPGYDGIEGERDALLSPLPTIYS